MIPIRICILKSIFNLDCVRLSAMASNSEFSPSVIDAFNNEQKNLFKIILYIIIVHIDCNNNKNQA